MGKAYCALLRGVNVNGVAIKMEALRAAFAEMGFSGIKTVLATGNVVFTDETGAPEAELKRRVEAELSARFDYDAHVFLRDEAELARLLARAKEFPKPEGCHLYALFAESDEVAAGLPGLFASLAQLPGEALALRGRDALWSVPKGGTTDSAFGSRILGSRKYKSAVTSRNVNTLGKIVGAMR